MHEALVSGLRNARDQCMPGLLRVLHYQRGLLSTLGGRRAALWGEGGPGWEVLRKAPRGRGAGWLVRKSFAGGGASPGRSPGAQGQREDDDLRCRVLTHIMPSDWDALFSATAQAQRISWDNG